ncbi:MAG: phosphoenolpyruvate--protein phosphotransferase [Gammaproteobacteria bacterium]|nr:phosphoenolpyruvate--protein phosphotransferase [Gammaproteobacteria bacterium]
MNLTLTGVGVSRGIAIGHAYLLAPEQPEISEYVLPKHLVAEEVARFKAALAAAKQQLKSIRNQIPRGTPASIAAFIETHVLMLEDAAFADAPVKLIKTQQCNAEWALKQQRDMLVSVFEAMNDPYLRTRKDDVDHVVNRIQRILANQPAHPLELSDQRLKGAIIVAADLSPADLLLIEHCGAAGFITEGGGPTSHTTILARGLGIPAIVGVAHALRQISHDALIAIDGQRGEVLTEPAPPSLQRLRAKRREEKRHAVTLARLSNKPSITEDGRVITLRANVELPEDIHAIKRAGAAGIGLYRTEFLFMNRKDNPSEEEQFLAYAQAAKAMKGMPVTIRTLDLGADKTLHNEHWHVSPRAPSPLGLRAIRLCLKEPALFRPQLRAILRASAYGQVRMMIPMLSSLQELFQVLEVIEDVKRELKEQGLKYNENIPIGGMIEVPSAALAAEAFARHLDFLSIGTNDLIQYTLATDRIDDAVNYLYDPLHPAVLRLIDMTIKAGYEAGIPVAMCGEMAGDPRYTRLLLGMGLTEFSTPPAMLLEVKSIIQSSHLARLAKIAKKIFACAHSGEIATLVDKINAAEKQERA